MKKLKVVFMGTPDFSVPILKELIKNTNVVLVVTSPDAYIGRKRILTECPVKKTALLNNIPVFSPKDIRKDYKEIINIEPDIIITCAYGQIIPKILLDLPPLGCINIHASLLPKYRGGAPIHHAIIKGDKKTGITIMYMDEKMDSGDMIKSQSIKIDDYDNIETLSSKLSILGTKMIIEVLPSIISGTNKKIKQNIKQVTYAPIITREDEKLDFNMLSADVFNKIRALSPAPLAYFKMLNTEFKIVECEVTSAIGTTSTVISVDKTSFTIMCLDKGIKITKIKPKGKNIMSTKDFFNGFNKEELLDKEVL
ncbi:MAG: methionyl-tRNA formyltransferase [Bacilli bacterium]|nr:methionyl-tRNA formyltransferase [Bacilli bacterium]